MTGAGSGVASGERGVAVAGSMEPASWSGCGAAVTTGVAVASTTAVGAGVGVVNLSPFSGGLGVVALSRSASRCHGYLMRPWYMFSAVEAMRAVMMRRSSSVSPDSSS